MRQSPRGFRTSLTALPARLALVLVMIGSSVLADDRPTRARSLTYDPQQRSWVELPPPPQGTPEGDLFRLRLLIKQNRSPQVFHAVDEFIKTHGQGNERYPEVLLVKAEAMVVLKQYDEAHEVLLAFLNEFGGMTLTEEALRLEFIIAEAYLKGAPRKLWGLPILPGEEVAFEILDTIAIDHPESSLAVLAVKTKADYLFHKGDPALAELDYARMLADFSQSRYSPYALRRAADSALASHAGVDYDDAALIEAQERYDEFGRRYPGEARREGVDRILTTIVEQRAEKEFTIGQYYERTRHLSSAIYYYQALIKDWPDTVASRKAAERLELLGVRDAATSTGS